MSLLLRLIHSTSALASILRLPTLWTINSTTFRKSTYLKVHMTPAYCFWMCHSFWGREHGGKDGALAGLQEKEKFVPKYRHSICPFASNKAWPIFEPIVCRIRISRMNPSSRIGSWSGPWFGVGHSRPLHMNTQCIHKILKSYIVVGHILGHSY